MYQLNSIIKDYVATHKQTGTHTHTHRLTMPTRSGKLLSLILFTDPNDKVNSIKIMTRFGLKYGGVNSSKLVLQIYTIKRTDKKSSPPYTTNGSNNTKKN